MLILEYKLSPAALVVFGKEIVIKMFILEYKSNPAALVEAMGRTMLCSVKKITLLMLNKLRCHAHF